MSSHNLTAFGELEYRQTGESRLRAGKMYLVLEVPEIAQFAVLSESTYVLSLNVHLDVLGSIGQHDCKETHSDDRVHLIAWTL